MKSGCHTLQYCLSPIRSGLFYLLFHSFPGNNMYPIVHFRVNASIQIWDMSERLFLSQAWQFVIWHTRVTIIYPMNPPPPHTPRPSQSLRPQTPCPQTLPAYPQRTCTGLWYLFQLPSFMITDSLHKEVTDSLSSGISHILRLEICFKLCLGPCVYILRIIRRLLLLLAASTTVPGLLACLLGLT